MTTGSGKNYVLCRPQGGLSDILSSVERCYNYAAAWGRTLVVDTHYSDRYFRDHLDRYFVSLRGDMTLRYAPGMLAGFEHDVFPPELAGRLDRYGCYYDDAAHLFRDNESKVPLIFRPDQDHAERVVLFHQMGGGNVSYYALAKMWFSPAVIARLAVRAGAIGEPYDAVHVRHTDYRTDYEAMVPELKAEMERPLFIASDNAACIAALRALVAPRRCLSFSKITGAEDAPMHILDGLAGDAVFENNIEAICDLVTLAMARNLTVRQVEPNVFKNKHSGFSVLAQNLWANRGFLIANLAKGDGAFGRLM